MVTLQALFLMYQKAFLEQESQIHEKLVNVANELADACKKGTKNEVKNAHAKMVEAMHSLHVSGRMEAFDAAHEKTPEFNVFCHYMRMVMEMMLFITAVRSGDWHLHLTVLKLFTKYFFAHDRLNYARMIPLYLAEMQVLPESDPEIYGEFLDWNWVVNKNPNTPFCALGADNALEHINRSMKVSGGLVGITLNPSAQAKFSLIAPELARLSEQAKSMAGISFTTSGSHHHALAPAVLAREDKSIEQLLITMESFTNPFKQDSGDSFNLVTKVVMQENVKKDLCEQSNIGQKLFKCFVKERFCQRVFCQREINIKEAIGTYEFSVVPRSMFAADGTMLRCSCKSALMNILEKLSVDRNDCNDPNAVQSEQNREEHTRVSIVDAMAEVQSLVKPEWVRNWSNLADHFISLIFEKYKDNEELRLIFDRYDLPSSLKEGTRIKRQGGQQPVYYRITASTHIAKVPIKKLLLHNKTKMELTDFLAQKIIQYGERNGRNVVVAWGSQCRGTNKDMSYLESNQEEADTKILLHAIDATANGATELRIHSPDIDVFVLSVRRYPHLCKNTSFVTGTGHNHREIKLEKIFHALGPAKAAALPAFHALSGADNTGCFSGKEKASCWKTFIEADEEIISGFSALGVDAIPSRETMALLEKFVCQLYVPRTDICTVKELRWWLFRKKQAQSEWLPPTQAALSQAILRAHYQLLVWNNDKVANPTLPSPENFGWTADENGWVPVMTKIPPAPDAIIYLVKCKSAKERCSANRCQCRKAGLSCTDLCSCSDSGELCENLHDNDGDDDDGYDDDDDDDDDSDDDDDDGNDDVNEDEEKNFYD